MRDLHPSLENTFKNTTVFCQSYPNICLGCKMHRNNVIIFKQKEPLLYNHPCPQVIYIHIFIRFKILRIQIYTYEKFIFRVTYVFEKNFLDRRFWEYIPPRQSCLHNEKEILFKSSTKQSQILGRQKTMAVVSAIHIVVQYWNSYMFYWQKSR